MKQIQSTYTITNNTLALLPARKIEYNTIVLEQNQQLYIEQTPLEIIKASCKAYWSNYEGRRRTTIKHTGFKQKTPIPISKLNQIIAFPTHSPLHHDCSWIIYRPHLQIIPHPEKTILSIGYEQSIHLDVSIHSLQKQIERAFIVYYKINRLKRKDSLLH